MSECFKADLHCHSHCSDGTASPKEIIDLAISLQLNGLSITDHDTVDAYTEAIDYAKEKGLKLIPGVEFSCTHRGESVHLLGYAFHHEHPLILNFSNKHIERRQNRAKEILALLHKHQIVLDAELLLKQNRFVGRPHIAKAMIDKGYVKDFKEAFRKYLGDNEPCYVPGNTFTVEETIDILHQAGAVAVVAHPHLIKKRRILSDLYEMEIDGIEAYYGRMSISQNRPFVAKAQELEIQITGGSDFHGEITPDRRLGSSWTPERSFYDLYELYQTNVQEWISSST